MRGIIQHDRLRLRLRLQPQLRLGQLRAGGRFHVGRDNQRESVPGVGTVLVNGQGRTLYLLNSEKGGKITCTDANGCTKIWPDTELPKGMTAAKAGSGVQASLLGTVKGDNGALYVTYNGWPLYTFSGDSGSGAAHGQGITSFGGTWYALTSSGNAATGQAASSPSSGGGGGYGY